jgi:hypothetical protein
VERFDKDGNRRLDAAERQTAAKFLREERAAGRGPGGRGGPGPALSVAPQVASQADKDQDGKVTREEFTGLAAAWFDKLDAGQTGKLSEAQFRERLRDVLPPAPGPGGPQGSPAGGPPGGPPGAGGRGGPGFLFDPSTLIASRFFAAGDADQDGTLARSELEGTFGNWFTAWDTAKDGSLTADEIRQGLEAILPAPARGGPGRGFPFRGENAEPPRPGPRLTPADVPSYPGAPLYDPETLRTFFLEFENPDWEAELAVFKDSDVEVPARLTVDGKVYADVGVHFRGMSSFMMIGEGRKRSLNLALDFVHEDQRLDGYRTLNLLNSHDDPTFLRAFLYSRIGREYVPTPKVNFARVVVNGESWGLYLNAQQFNKDFVKEWFGTTKGARWKVPGSPGGQGSLAYLGEEVAPYKRLYELKSKDDPQAWTDLIRLTKVLNETPADRLEEALAPLLDIDGALKFLALENALINNDGYWIRTSDYNLYLDEKGRFHLIPHDTGETFSGAGGPGFGVFGGGGFGRGMLAQHIRSAADGNGDGKLGREELLGLADAWFDKLDPEKAGKLSAEEFTKRIGGVLPEAPGPGPGPASWVGPGLFRAADADHDGSLARDEFRKTFGDWAASWGAEKPGELTEEELANGLRGILPRQDAAGPAGNFGGPVRREPGERRAPDGGPGPAGGPPGAGPGPGPAGGGPGFAGGPRGGGVELDPLVAANDARKPLLSKLLAVPALRERYLGHVRHLAEKWLDWQTLGPIAERYHALIASDVKEDTRKLDSGEDFDRGLAGAAPERTGGGPGAPMSLKAFADARRAYLLKQADEKNEKKGSP